MGEAGQSGDGWSRNDEPEAFVRVCPQCGREVSDGSAACPNCATPEMPALAARPSNPPEPPAPPVGAEHLAASLAPEPAEAPPRRCWWWTLPAVAIAIVAVAAVTMQRGGDDTAADDEWLLDVPTEVNELFEIELTRGDRPHSIVGSRERVFVLAGPPGDAEPRSVSMFDGDGSLQHQFDVAEGTDWMTLVDDSLLTVSHASGEVWVHSLDGVERWRREGYATLWGDGSVILAPPSNPPDEGSFVLQQVDLEDGTVVGEFKSVPSGTRLGDGFHAAIEGDDVQIRNSDFETVFTWRDADLGEPNQPVLQFDGERLYTAVDDVLAVHDGDEVTGFELPGTGSVASLSLIDDMLIVSRYDPNGSSLATAYRIDSSGELDEAWSAESDFAAAYGGLIALYGTEHQVLWPDGEPVDVVGRSASMYVVGPTTVQSNRGVSHFNENTRELEWQIETGPSSNAVILDEAIAIYDETAASPIVKVYGEE